MYLWEEKEEIWVRSFVLITCILTMDELDTYTVGCSVQLISRWTFYCKLQIRFVFQTKNVSLFSKKIFPTFSITNGGKRISMKTK